MVEDVRAETLWDFQIQTGHGNLVRYCGGEQRKDSYSDSNTREKVHEILEYILPMGGKKTSVNPLLKLVEKIPGTMSEISR